MKYVDEFRDPQAAQRLVEEIRRLATRPWVLMEVCGGQTHGLLRYGIEESLGGAVELIHGPGCPVCVTPAEDIDQACVLASRPGIILASFGDMLRVPGHNGSLLEARARGADVRPVYSPVDAVRIAQAQPDREVVFFAVGFETTTPATALAVLQAAEAGTDNFSLLDAHVRVLPAMEAVLAAPENRVQGFLAAGHVCTVTGFEEYHELASRFGVPIVVTGFEPVDLLEGIRDCIRQLEAGTATVTNHYARSVRPGGNTAAQGIVNQVYEVADVAWRGFGVIPAGGLRLRPKYQHYDARHRYQITASRTSGSDTHIDECPAAKVLAGRMKPPECPQFGTACTPTTPLGAPMVSSEGACAAYFRYRPGTAEAHGTVGTEAGAQPEDRTGVKH
ncbi:MAG: hydrogenase formation protein HypD [Planctomycetaceae bacterium]|nr:hydrogenase formation protein HypD [Planctomycetaceae bacterium]